MATGLPQMPGSQSVPTSSIAVCQGTAWKGQLCSPATAGTQEPPSGATESPNAPVSLGDTQEGKTGEPRLALPSF